MTGGTAEARANQPHPGRRRPSSRAWPWASAPCALPSKTKAWIDTYDVRDVAPDILLFANLGAVQLNYGYGVDECQRAVEMIEADALILHFNALQEAVQPEGDGDFSGLLDKIENICAALPVPVIAKEVGWGFSEANRRRPGRCRGGGD